MAPMPETAPAPIADPDALASCVNRLVEIADAAGPARAPVASRDTQVLPLAAH